MLVQVRPEKRLFTGKKGSTVKAARYHGKGDIRIEEIPEPTPRAGEVQVRVAFNGICGSDLHEFYVAPRAVPVQPHPLTGARLPVVLGHEAAGYVSAVGDGVQGISEGALVTIDPVRCCHECFSCRAGHHNLCDRLALHGYSTGGGGLAQYTVVSQDMVHVLPAGVGPQQAALVEPLAIAHHAVARWEKPAEGSAAIFGGGPIGIAILLTLKASGVAPVFVVEPAPYRRSLANALGAVVIDPTRGDSATEIRDMTFGHGVDVAFETAGAATTFQAAVGSMAKRGTVVVVSSGHQPVEAPLSQMLRSELTIRTTFASCGDFPPVIELVQSGAFPLDGWVDTIGIDDLLGGFEALRTGTALKLLVDPWA